MVVQGEQFAKLGRKALRILKILYTQRTAGDFVFISRTDTATCGTDRPPKGDDGP